MEEHFMEAPARLARSSFVTLVAWIVIAMAGFSTVVALFQNVALVFLFPVMEKAMQSSPPPEEFSPLAQFMSSHFRLLAAVFLGWSATLLACAVGLLQRRNWARLLFVFLLGVSIVWNIAGIFLQQFAMPTPPAAPPGFRDFLAAFATFIRIFSAVAAVAVSVLFGWLIKRFVSAPIRAEFTAANV